MSPPRKRAPEAVCLKHFVFDVCSDKRHNARWVHKSTFHPHPASLQTTTGPTATTHEGIAGLHEVAEGVAHISFDPNFAIMARLPDGTRVRQAPGIAQLAAAVQCC